ncbi:MAG: GNAT family N-acetyltransferase [Flavobacteriales bacterium]|nr:GNAT family N-acetyltransferase [Flavobacteriales bacterium]
MKIGTTSEAKVIADIGYKSFRHFFETDTNRAELLPYIEVAFSEEHILKEFEANKNTFLLAKDEELTIGFARLWEQKVEEIDKKALKMERLYLYPEMVGTGAGAFLMQASIDFAKKEGYEVLWLQVFRPNTKAIRFYEKWGFSEFHTSPAKFEADNEIDLWLARPIS